jgi:hypothetical protein
MIAEFSTLEVTLPRLPISTSGLLDSLSLGACATALLDSPILDVGSFSASRRDIAESRRFLDSSNNLVLDALNLGTCVARVEGPETVALPLVALVLVDWATFSLYWSWEDSISSEASLGLRNGSEDFPRRPCGAGAEGATLARFGRGIVVISRFRINSYFGLWIAAYISLIIA